MEISVVLIESLGDYPKSHSSIMKNDLKIAKEIGDREGEGGACGNLGTAHYGHWVTIRKSH